jgi:hypothetical protein
MAEIPRMGYDALPIQMRRANWGWFGEPWWSYVCYDEDGRLLEDMRKPFPVGESCLYCGEVFDEAAGDNGQAMPLSRADGSAAVIHVHKECMLREVVGTVSCLEGHHHHDTGRTPRQEALASWAWVQEHGARAMQ